MDQEQTKQLLSYLERISSALERIDIQLPTTGVTTDVTVTGIGTLVEQLDYLSNLNGLVAELEKVNSRLESIESNLGFGLLDIENDMDPNYSFLKHISDSLSIDREGSTFPPEKPPYNVLTEISDTLKIIANNQK
tara:strand:+ start:80 stop:484 length:405 start_codon:yes stop_codon:yes gene_type:complete